jgi:hypothetical protein
MALAAKLGILVLLETWNIGPIGTLTVIHAPAFGLDSSFVHPAGNRVDGHFDAHNFPEWHDGFVIHGTPIKRNRPRCGINAR